MPMGHIEYAKKENTEFDKKAYSKKYYQDNRDRILAYKKIHNKEKVCDVCVCTCKK